MEDVQQGAPRTDLTASRGVPFDHLTGGGIDDFSSFAQVPI
jgi:hypothetical protein